MIKFDDLISVYRKISIVSYTNSELIEILKDDSTVNFLNILIECDIEFDGQVVQKYNSGTVRPSGQKPFGHVSRAWRSREKRPYSLDAQDGRQQAFPYLAEY